MGDNKRGSAKPPLQTEDGSFEQALDMLSPEQRTVIERSMVSFFAMVGQSSPENAVSKQITSEHITKIIDNQQESMKLTYKDENNKRILFAFVIIVLLAAVIGIIFLLKDQPETMEKILTILITAIISGLGGYGIGKGLPKNDD